MIGHYARLGIVPAYILLCLLLGGASNAGFWENMALQLIALPIIFWSLIERRDSPIAPSARHLLILASLMLIVGLFQLVPLPPAIWASLPGRSAIADGFNLVGQPVPWLPLSLAPTRTIASLLWLLPALAVLLGVIRLGEFKAGWIAWVIAVVAVFSVAIGALQLAGGNLSPWYFYQITNQGATVGFFANANHLATLLVVAIPFLAAIYLGATRKGHSAQRSSGLLVILSGSLAVVIVGIVLNFSLAGMGLMVPAIAASVLMILSRKKKLPAWSGAAVGLLLIAVATAIFLAPIGNNLTSTGASTDTASRYTSFSISGEATADHLPVGSGIGSFVQIYQRYENPANVSRYYMNHVHGDYIELALETGLPGMAVLLVFLAWWGRRTVAIWRAEKQDYYAVAATIASAVILAHSLVDYPLRTAAISVLFAACCALMAEPRARVQQRDADPGETRARHLSAD